MFLSRNKNNNVYPCKPQFYYIKVGLKGGQNYIGMFSWWQHSGKPFWKSWGLWKCIFYKCNLNITNFKSIRDCTPENSLQTASSQDIERKYTECEILNLKMQAAHGHLKAEDDQQVNDGDSINKGMDTLSWEVTCYVLSTWWNLYS